MVAKTILGVVLLLTFALVITNTAELKRLAGRVEDLRTNLPTRSDVAMLRPLHVGTTLLKHCTTCHTDRKFKEAYGVGPDALTLAVLKHPGSERLGRAEAERISAAMILTRCTGCHGEEVVAQLGLRSHEARLQYLRRKVREQRPLFETHEVRHVLWAIDTLLGEPHEIDDVSRPPEK